MEFIDLNAQYVALKNDIDEGIRNVLTHGQFILGPEVERLEAEISAFIGVKHTITCANGTDALQLLYMEYGVGSGDAVFAPDVTFIATVEPAAMLGATPVFCDISIETFNICPKSLERQISAVLQEGKLKPRAVVTVDFIGNPAQYDEIAEICKKYGLLLIEDAAQSFGAMYGNKRCGALGDAATTSFFPAKPLGCYGDGGAIFTNDDDVAYRLRSMRAHGKGKSKYDNVRVGVNSRLDTLQAAILLPKLAALRNYEIDARQEIAARYNNAFKGKFQLQRVLQGNVSTWAQYALLAKSTENRDFILSKLANHGIPSLVYYPTPQHALPVFRDTCAYGETFKHSSDYCARTFSLPMHPYLSEVEQDKVISAVLACANG